MQGSSREHITQIYLSISLYQVFSVIEVRLTSRKYCILDYNVPTPRLRDRGPPPDQRYVPQGHRHHYRDIEKVGSYLFQSILPDQDHGHQSFWIRALEGFKGGGRVYNYSIPFLVTILLTKSQASTWITPGKWMSTRYQRFFYKNSPNPLGLRRVSIFPPGSPGTNVCSLEISRLLQPYSHMFARGKSC